MPIDRVRMELRRRAVVQNAIEANLKRKRDLERALRVARGKHNRQSLTGQLRGLSSLLDGQYGLLEEIFFDACAS